MPEQIEPLVDLRCAAGETDSLNGDVVLVGSHADEGANEIVGNGEDEDLFADRLRCGAWSAYRDVSTWSTDRRGPDGGSYSHASFLLRSSEKLPARLARAVGPSRRKNSTPGLPG